MIDLLIVKHDENVENLELFLLIFPGEIYLFESLSSFTESAPVLSENIRGNHLSKNDIDDHIEFAVDNFIYQSFPSVCGEHIF